ncbi:MAG: hypothetical protein ACFFD2_20960 [Promethearchaeota archaeon]
MRDTVTITSVGRSIGFTIAPDLLKKSELKLGELAEIEIYEIIKGTEPRPISVYMSRKIISVGGVSKGVTIKHNVAKEFKLKVGDMIGIDIKG